MIEQQEGQPGVQELSRREFYSEMTKCEQEWIGKIQQAIAMVNVAMAAYQDLRGIVQRAQKAEAEGQKVTYYQDHEKGSVGFSIEEKERFGFPIGKDGEK